MNSRLELPSGLSEYEYQMKAILVTTYLIGATVPRLGPLAERALRIPLTESVTVGSYFPINKSE